MTPMPKNLRLADICKACLMLLVAGMAASCTPQISPPVTVKLAQTPADFPEAYYLQAEVSGSKIYRIDTKGSLITIDVRRGGVLERLGHNHVVASRDVTGYVDMTAGRADLFVPLDLLVVDEPGLRAEAGLASQLAQEAIEGTRRNMLDKVLETRNYPFAFVRIIRRTPDETSLDAAITLHNTLNNFHFPAKIETTPGGIKISGQMTLNQTDFGITPFSILGGAMQVQDKLDLHFRIFATSHF